MKLTSFRNRAPKHASLQQRNVRVCCIDGLLCLRKQIIIMGNFLRSFMEWNGWNFHASPYTQYFSEVDIKILNHTDYKKVFFHNNIMNVYFIRIGIMYVHHTNVVLSSEIRLIILTDVKRASATRFPKAHSPLPQGLSRNSSSATPTTSFTKLASSSRYGFINALISGSEKR